VGIELGNLYATLLVVDPVPASTSPQSVLSLKADDAVLDICSGLVLARLKIKWPNDLLLDSAKVSGFCRRNVGNQIATAIGWRELQTSSVRHVVSGKRFLTRDLISRLSRY
jgi:biotin-(acetyl-CoA carboxylase) ligase